jgi:hypothetical protein
LDEVVAWAEEAACEPWIRALDYGTEHAAEKELGIAAVPTFVADLVELPPNGDELGEINIIIGIIDGTEASGFGRKSDDIFYEKRRGYWVGRSERR